MKKITVAVKLWALTIFLLASVAGLGAFSYVSAEKLMFQLNIVAGVQLPAVRYMTLADMMHDKIRGDVLALEAAVYSKNEKMLKEANEELESGIKDFNKNIEALDRLRLNREIREAIQDTKPQLRKYIEEARAMQEVSRADDGDALAKQFESFNVQFAVLEKKMSVLGDLIEGQAGKISNSGEERLKLTGMITLIAIFVGVLFSTMLIPTLVSNIRMMSGRVERTSSAVNELSQELSNISSEISESTSEAAASMEETVATIQQMSQLIDQNANAAAKAETEANQAKHEAEQGAAEAKRLNEAMVDIKGNSTKIQEITSVIESISFQTNLLALNAAVEAARAGDQGKGFAVVAESVRSLAQRSSSATRDIRKMIDESVASVERGTKIANHAVQKLSSITNKVDSMTQLNRQINESSAEQSQAIKQITEALNQLDKITQQNSNSTAKVSGSASTLKDASENLHDSVNELTDMMIGKKSA